MNRKLILGAVISTVAVGMIALSPIAANAQPAQNNNREGGYAGTKGSGNGLEIKAQAINMTTEQLKEQLQTKTMAEIISDKGITAEQYKEKVQKSSQERWKEMGLSDEEIQRRVQAQEKRQANCDNIGTNYGIQGGLRRQFNQ